MIPDIDYKKTKLRDFRVTTGFLKEQKLSHLIPTYTPKQQVMRHTSKRREILNNMLTLNSDPKYGPPRSIERPNT